MIPILRSGLVAGLLAVTTAVAGIGWYRSAHTQNSSPVNGIPYTATALNSSDPNAPAANAGYNNSGAYAPGTNNCNETGNYVAAHSADYAYSGAPYVSDRYVQSIHRPIRVSYAQAGGSYSDSRPYNTGYEEHTRVVERYHHGRSTGKSVAIVAGSAAGGAAIGAIAGGGKGAGIGALAGGAGGFIYDRLTHNH